ncbi:hypothetical protein CROQUDRAFT_93327 [Cronartium quercuum f. sp. fusiforme G11]|uniref:Uncharacterized protein n=1 Tax=Cronartium quercuum f. sp. fusiforme G11 TaxID=708437 RepID=A0A9P6NKT4_9BASI|nr:hypothetical protein CROQUDRAFT_93327 [Cronartium quercuum f. sp. fusiforme G11]
MVGAGFEPAARSNGSGPNTHGLPLTAIGYRPSTLRCSPTFLPKRIFCVVNLGAKSTVPEAVPQNNKAWNDGNVAYDGQVNPSPGSNLLRVKQKGENGLSNSHGKVTFGFNEITDHEKDSRFQKELHHEISEKAHKRFALQNEWKKTYPHWKAYIDKRKDQLETFQRISQYRNFFNNKKYLEELNQHILELEKFLAEKEEKFKMKISKIDAEFADLDNILFKINHASSSDKIVSNGKVWVDSNLEDGPEAPLIKETNSLKKQELRIPMLSNYYSQAKYHPLSQLQLDEDTYNGVLDRKANELTRVKQKWENIAPRLDRHIKSAQKGLKAVSESKSKGGLIERNDRKKEEEYIQALESLLDELETDCLETNQDLSKVSPDPLQSDLL